MRDLAAEIALDLPDVVDQVDFVSTVVDRITPRATAQDRASLALATGRHDAAPVVTEPFSEWVLQGDFPSGRPSWESVGARFVADLAPFEQRKLWLLNGAHSLLAYAGGVRGHQTVAEAVADPRCRQEVEQWWDQVQPHLGLPAGGDRGIPQRSPRDASPTRACGTSWRRSPSTAPVKLPLRVLPVLRAERAGRT